MKKVILGMGLFMVSWAANAISVSLVSWQTTDNGTTITTQITDGSHDGFVSTDGQDDRGVLPTTATFDWDGTVLTSTGYLSATGALGSTIYGPAILSHVATNLSIDTSTSTSSATSYVCVEGTFLGGVGASGCGGTGFGANFMNDSTTTWGPGTAVSQTIGGDDTPAGGPQTQNFADYGLVSWDGTTLVLGAGTLGTVGAAAMTFTAVPVPAAVWLFGSALGLLGWARRKTS